MTVVLDASALLALLLNEPGKEQVKKALANSMISSLNWGEVTQILLRKEFSTEGVRAALQALGLVIEPLSTEQAEGAAALWNQGKAYGLSMGDRVCVFLGTTKGERILTADKVWAEAFPDLPISLIR